MEEIILKKDFVVKIRKLSRGDEEKLREFSNALSERSRYDFLPHEYDDTTLDKLIVRNESGEDIALVAEYEKNIIGYFFLWYVRRPVALLGIGIIDKFQGMGLGQKVMELLIELGRKNGLEGIELSTAADNDRAYALYEKVGFAFVRDVETFLGDGSVRFERCMFLSMKEGARPTDEPHRCPV